MNGILIVNKPEGITSQGVVSKVKKALNVKKVVGDTRPALAIARLLLKEI